MERHSFRRVSRDPPDTLWKLCGSTKFPHQEQRQLSRCVLSKRCSENMQQVHRRTPMPKCNSSVTCAGNQSRTLTSQKSMYYLLCWKSFKNDENAFYFILKALLILKIIKFLWWLFVHVRKTTWLRRYGYFPNWWRHNLVKKQLGYTYCPITHKVKAAR